MTRPLDNRGADEALNADRLGQRLETGWLARRLVVFKTIGSTNDYALALPDLEAVHGLAVLAERQTAGRGRFARRWEAPRGRALLMTLVLRGEGFGQAGSALTMATSVAVRRVLGRAGCGPCQIRWPNDVLLSGRKVCGILTEAGPWRATPGWAVGIGLNVNQAREDFPAALRQGATSLAAEAGRVFDRHALFAELAWELESSLEALASGPEGREAIRREWEGASCLLGRIVAVDTGEEIVEGMAMGLEADGGLIVRLEAGPLRTLRAGTVVKS